MGGKLFNTERINMSTYNKIIQHLDHIDGTSFALNFINNLSDKHSFGDVDVIVKRNRFDKFYEKFSKVMKIVETVKTKNYVSVCILFEDNRVHLNFILSDVPEFASIYYSYGCFGQLLGKVARSLNLKLTVDGLFYNTKQGDFLITDDFYNALIIMGYNTEQGDFLITDDFYKALIIMGYNPNITKEFFDNYKTHKELDIFKFISSSKFFSYHPFVIMRCTKNDRDMIVNFKNYCDKKSIIINNEQVSAFTNKHIQILHHGFVGWLTKQKKLSKTNDINHKKLKKARLKARDYTDRIPNISEQLKTEIKNSLSKIEVLDINNKSSYEIYVEYRDYINNTVNDKGGSFCQIIEAEMNKLHPVFNTFAKRVFHEYSNQYYVFCYHILSGSDRSEKILKCLPNDIARAGHLFHQLNPTYVNNLYYGYINNNDCLNLHPLTKGTYVKFLKHYNEWIQEVEVPKLLSTCQEILEKINGKN